MSATLIALAVMLALIALEVPGGQPQPSDTAMPEE
jgi:hypothetical protein